MRLFDQDFCDLLNKELCGDEIYSVYLGRYFFRVEFFEDINIRNMEKVVFRIDRRNFEGTGDKDPVDAPVWRLIGQQAKRFLLVSETILRMELESGDFIDFYTAQSQHESHIVEFPDQGEAFVMEIF